MLTQKSNHYEYREWTNSYSNKCRVENDGNWPHGHGCCHRNTGFPIAITLVPGLVVISDPSRAQGEIKNNDDLGRTYNLMFRTRPVQVKKCAHRYRPEKSSFVN